MNMEIINRIMLGKVTSLNTSFNAYNVEPIIEDNVTNIRGRKRFVGIPISFLSENKQGKAFISTYEIGDLVLIIVPFYKDSKGYTLKDNSCYIIGSISQLGRVPMINDQLYIGDGEGARMVIGDQYLASGSTGNINISAKKLGLMSGENYVDWAKQTNYDYYSNNVIIDESYSGSQIRPAVPDAGLFISRDTGEKIWLNSGSISMAAYGFYIVASGSLSGGDTSDNPQWDLDMAQSGTIVIKDNNGNTITLTSSGVNINSTADITYSSDGDIIIDSQQKVIVNAADQIELNGSDSTIIASGDNITISGQSNFKISGLITTQYITGRTTNMGPVLPSTSMEQIIEMKAGSITINAYPTGNASITHNAPARKVKTSGA